jgi:hypothetical protein
MLLALAVLIQASSTEPTGILRSPRLREISGVAVSRAHPGVLWTHNDSGDRPFLYATDLAGTDRGSVIVSGARAVDWEDIAIGPCPEPDRHRYGSCIFIGDVGDNGEDRSSVMLYAVPEPVPPRARADTLRTTRAPRRLRLRYPDGARDVEAIYTAPSDGAVFLVSKGRSGPIRLYRAEARWWAQAGDTSFTAVRVQDLPIRPDRGAGRWITGAAIRPDGRLVALRTADEVYFFTPGAGGRLEPAEPSRCRIGRYEYQGEAIDFLDDSTLVVMSEAGGRKRPGRIHVLRCLWRDAR